MVRVAPATLLMVRPAVSRGTCKQLPVGQPQERCQRQRMWSGRVIRIQNAKHSGWAMEGTRQKIIPCDFPPSVTPTIKCGS